MGMGCCAQQPRKFCITKLQRCSWRRFSPPPAEAKGQAQNALKGISLPSGKTAEVILVRRERRIPLGHGIAVDSSAPIKCTHRAIRYVSAACVFGAGRSNTRGPLQNLNSGSTVMAQRNLTSSDLLKTFSRGTSLRLHHEMVIRGSM